MALTPHPLAKVTAEDLLPDINSADAVTAAAEDFFRFTQTFPIDLGGVQEPTLHTVLEWGGAHSSTGAVWSTYDQPGSEVISVFAARMLLEEAARTSWRFSVSGEEFKVRATQYFDEYRARKGKTINLLASSGVPRTEAIAFFALPDFVDARTLSNVVAKGRAPIPSVTSMLGEFGTGFPEPGWLVVAYSLLSQITHSTPLGLLHSVRPIATGFRGGGLSPEMLALALDVTCLASASLLRHSALVLTDAAPESRAFGRGLQHRAGVVHDRARMVHGLD
jgi:hypothetical protein